MMGYEESGVGFPPPGEDQWSNVSCSPLSPPWGEQPVLKICLSGLLSCRSCYRAEEIKGLSGHGGKSQLTSASKGKFNMSVVSTWLEGAT